MSNRVERIIWFAGWTLAALLCMAASATGLTSCGREPLHSFEQIPAQEQEETYPAEEPTPDPTCEPCYCDGSAA